MTLSIRESSRAEELPAEPRARRADVQGLRAVAVLMVVAFHADLPVPGGFTGVDVFFVVSGFVITGLIKREVGSPAGFSLVRFYSRRARRLLPALALLISVVAVLSLVLESPAGAQQVTTRTGVAAALSVANLEIYRSTGGYFDGPAAGNPLLHTWSLSVEEQFYVVFPLILFLLLRFASRAQHRLLRLGSTVAVLLGLALASYLLAVYLVGGGRLPGISLPAQFAFYASPTRGWEFVAGAVIALLAGALARVPRYVGLVLGATGAVLLAAACWRVSDTSSVPAAAALVPVAGTSALIAGGTVYASVVTRALSARWLVALGDMSYSVYLWHWPMIVFARRLFPSSPYAPVAGAAVGFAVAWWAFHHVENPIRTRQRAAAASGLRVAAVATTVSLSLLAAGLGVRSILLSQADTRAFVEAATDGHYADEKGCDAAASLAASRPAACDTSVAGAAKTVYLLGDSQAGHFSEGILSAAAQLRWNVSIATENGCAYAPVQAGCASVQPSVDAILTRPPGIVIIATEVDGWIKRPDALVSGPPPESLPSEERISIWVGATNRIVEPLVAAGHRVLLVQPTPRFYDWSPADCLALTAYLDPPQCGTTTGRAAAEINRADAVAAQEQLAGAPGVEVIDFFDHFCDETRCYTNRGNSWYARNVDHISAAASRELSPHFDSAFRRWQSW